MKTLYLLLIISLLALHQGNAQERKKVMVEKIEKSEEEWKKELSPQEYYILREKGTDRPGQGGFTAHFEKGTYHCAAWRQKRMQL